jgi:hypothetical protein
MKPNHILLLSLISIWIACTTPVSMQQSQSYSTQKFDSTKRFQKILFVALLKDDYTRRVAEDKLVEQVRPRGVASYTYLPNYTANADTAMLSRRLQEDGFDGVVIMRLITMNKNSANSPGNNSNYYNSWYGYYSSTFPLYNVPGNYSANDLYNIQTNVYSLKDNKLVWTGVTTTVNISDKKTMMDKVIATVKQSMRDQGLIK